MTPVLERELEKRVLTAAMTRARAGTGSLVIVRSGFGHGRSTLLSWAEETARSQGIQVRHASAVQAESVFGYAVLEQLTAEPRSRLDVLADELRASGPVLITVDDVQWADQPSLRRLGGLGQRLAGLPVVLVCSVLGGATAAERPAVRDLLDEARETLVLAPLSTAASAELARHWLAGRDAEHADACADSACGNPMLVKHLCRVTDSAGEVPATRPGLFRALLGERLRALAPESLAYAQAKALLAGCGDPAVVAELAGLDAIGASAATGHLIAMGVFSAAGDPASAVVAAGLLDSLSPESKEHLHRRAAILLHKRGLPVRLVAEHVRGFITATPGWAVEALMAAADEAELNGEPGLAAGYLRRGLLSPALEAATRARLLIRLARVSRPVDQDLAVGMLCRAARLAPSSLDRAAVLVHLEPAVLGTAPPSVRALIEETAAALGDPARLRGTARELALRLQARLCVTGHERPGLREDVTARLANADPDAGTGAERELLAVVLKAATDDLALRAADVAAAGIKLLAHASARASHVYTETPLVVTSMVAAEALGPLVPWLETATREAAVRGLAREESFACAERAFVALRAGRTDQARMFARRSLELGGPDWTLDGGSQFTLLAAVAIEAHEDELGERLLTRIDVADGPLATRLPMARLLRACLPAAGRDLATLAQLVDAGRDWDRAGCRNPAVVPWRGWAVARCRELGRVGQGVELAEEELALARTWGAPTAIGRALRVYGELLEDSRGDKMLGEAVEVLEEGSVFELAQAWLARGLRLRAAGEDAGLDRVARLAAQCRNPWLDRRTEGLLERRSGPGPALLTARERRVAELVVGGSTNTGVAAMLKITLRAVEKHLTSCYRKLGVSGRAGLAGALEAGGYLRTPNQQADTPQS